MHYVALRDELRQVTNATENPPVLVNVVVNQQQLSVALSENALDTDGQEGILMFDSGDFCSQSSEVLIPTAAEFSDSPENFTAGFQMNPEVPEFVPSRSYLPLCNTEPEGESYCDVCLLKTNQHK